MTLPSSGQLSINDIKGEFGGPASPSLANYYAGGAYVPSGTSGTNGAVPNSGAISIFNFYGTSNFSPHTDSFTSSGSATVPSGAVQLIIETWGGGGNGGSGATGGSDHQGGGGASGSYAKSILSLSGDAGKTITVTISGKTASTSGPSVNGGAVATSSTGGSDGLTATGTTNGSGGTTPGTASGGNNTNTNGATGQVGNSGGTAGAGAARIAGGAGGGHGGYTISNTGQTNGDGAAVNLSWS